MVYSLVFPSQYEYIDAPAHVPQTVGRWSYRGFRLTAYWAFLILALGECSLNVLTIVFPDTMLLLTTSIVGIVFAVWTLAWISILLLFNNRPTSNHLLSKGKAHFLSFVFFSVLWFVLACMWTIPAGLECNPDAFRNGHAQVWCGFTISEAILGWLLFSLSLSLAFIIYKQSSKIGLQWNISPSEKPRISIGGIPYNPYC